MRNVEKLAWAAAVAMCALFPLDFFKVAPFTIFGLPFGWHFFPEIALCFLCGWLFTETPKRYMVAAVAYCIAIPITVMVALSLALDSIIVLFAYPVIIGVLPVLLGFMTSKLFSWFQKKL
ncbi:hypothetical protein G4O51_03850 [Candidatus Bathyarchaeota archaeon A05DMB-2]|jgi:asparagine N-glycosylation enzyme membrane subunit Stt3|nr:hypothetical protein [Candidatus Bathyarchaeota archaeon A05DMB-2]